MSTLTVLQTTDLPDDTVAALGARFDILRLPDPGPERDALLAEHGAHVRGIAGTGKGRVDEALLDRLPNLEVISSYSAGLEEIDVDAVERRGIVLANTSTILAAEVADTAVWLLVAVFRRLVEADRFVRDGKWLTDKFPLARSVAGAKVGILGLGHIGKAIARRLAVMDATIAYHGRRKQDGVDYPYFGDLQDLADWADALVVCTPETPETIKLVDGPILDALGSDGVVVNIARGTVIDEAALVKALADGRIAGAGLDVFADEPNVPEPLLDDPKVVLLPHLASGTVETRARMGQAMIEVLTRHFDL